MHHLAKMIGKCEMTGFYINFGTATVLGSPEHREHSSHLAHSPYLVSNNLLPYGNALGCFRPRKCLWCITILSSNIQAFEGVHDRVGVH